MKSKKAKEAVDLRNKRKFIYICVSIFVGYIVYLFLFSSFLNKEIDDQYQKGSIKTGKICYLGYETHTAKSSSIQTYTYYFSIDGLKSKAVYRPYFPFKQQYLGFIERMDRNKCYKAKYIEVSLSFYKHRMIYQIIDKY